MLRRVFQITLTTELMRLGITAQRAGNLTARFIDRGGERPAVWRSNPYHPHRLPRHMFVNPLCLRARAPIIASTYS
jgi:hypothetical protein